MKYLNKLWFLVLLYIVVLCMGVIINIKAETNTVSSTVVTNSTPPTANAPSIINSNSDICKVGVGGSVQNNVLGVATGVLIDDTLCQKLKLSRSMYQYGMKVAAVSILCQDSRVWDSMTDAGTPCPVKGLIGAEAAAYWEANPDEIPEGSRYKVGYIQQVKEEKPEGDFDDIKNFGLMALSLLLLF
tara:strand:- start:1196 stop:1753 length:558 start_codon:yes stop_codon:yes gene_type:complete